MVCIWTAARRVRPRTGLRIETPGSRHGHSGVASGPARACGLKPVARDRSALSTQVRPRTGLRIETTASPDDARPYGVRPRTGLRIETKSGAKALTATSSGPARACGLKQHLIYQRIAGLLSGPARACGLKLLQALRPAVNQGQAPHGPAD